MAQDCKPGGTFLINCAYDVEELGKVLPVEAKQLYCQANHVQCLHHRRREDRQRAGSGHQVQHACCMSAFFKLANIIPIDDAVRYMKEACQTSYGKLGDEVVNKNKNAVDAGLTGIVKLDIPADWATTTEGGVEAMPAPSGNQVLDTFVKDVLIPANAQRGDEIPVSKLLPEADGSLPLRYRCL